MKIRFYGPLAETIGSNIDIEVPAGSSVSKIRAQLQRDYPKAAAQLHRSRAITAERTAGEEHRLGPADDLEFLPPVSGG